MTPPVPALSEVATGLCIFFILLVPFASIGLALINTGLCRSRNAAHMMLASLVVMGVAAGVYFILGFSFQGYPGRPPHIATLAGKPFDWLGAEPILMRGVGFDGSRRSLAALLGTLTVGLVALIPLGAGAERWRLRASAVSTALLAGWTYPLFAHWVWGGWLRQLGENFGLGRGFVDAGGSGAIQAVGGLTALSVAWILGPRKGKYARDGTPTAMPGHNAVLVLLGCLAAWVGWLGLNSSGALLFSGTDARSVTLVGVNTTLAAASGALVALVLTRGRFGKPDASLTANSWVAGLVASSAACPFVRPAAAAAIGAVAGGLVAFAVPWFESKLTVDDPGGAISVHGLGGLWGIMAVSVFSRFPTSPGASCTSGQWLAQLVGVATLLGFVFPMTYGLNWLLNRVFRQRVAAEAEAQGLDLHELGAGAYPEFMTHTDEFTER